MLCRSFLPTHVPDRLIFERVQCPAEESVKRGATFISHGSQRMEKNPGMSLSALVTHANLRYVCNAQGAATMRVCPQSHHTHLISE